MISCHQEKNLDTQVASVKWIAIKHLWLYRKGSPELPGDTLCCYFNLDCRTQHLWASGSLTLHVCVFRGGEGERCLFLPQPQTEPRRNIYTGVRRSVCWPNISGAEEPLRWLLWLTLTTASACCPSGSCRGIWAELTARVAGRALQVSAPQDPCTLPSGSKVFGTVPGPGASVREMVITIHTDICYRKSKKDICKINRVKFKSHRPAPQQENH